jgi:hypothetical protein
MPSDDQREVTEYIIQALVEGRSRDEVARNVAQRYELNLRQAEGLVLRVETVYDRDITARRSPIYFGISLLTLLGGVALIVFPLLEILRPLWNSLAAGQTWQQASSTAREVLFANVPLLLLGLGLIIAGIRTLKHSTWRFHRK